MIRHSLRHRVAVGLVAGGLALAAAPTAATAASASVPNISGNWSGYVVPGSGITSVSGEWTVPNAGTLPPGVSSTWVGIGGYSTTDLIQAGTQQSSSPYSSIFAGGAYGAWIEMLPANPVFITGCNPDPNCTVNPGDVMQVVITNNGGSSWTVSLSDNGRWTYSTPETYTSTESSAEWIHEAPSAAGAVPIPVGGSGTVTFDGANSAVINGVSDNIAASGAISVVALPVETTPSSLDSDGDGFNVCTYALTCSPSGS